MRAVAAALAAVTALVLAGCSGSGSGSSGPPPTMRDIGTALARHGHAVLAHDRSGFLAGVGGKPGAAQFRADQTAQFDNLRQLPLTRWSYAVAGRSDDAAAQAAARRRYGASAVVVRLTLTYALRAVDRVPTTHTLWWTFVRAGGQVVAVADDGLADAGGVSWQGPWDFGPLDVVRGSHSLVIGHPDNARLLPTIAATVDAAVPVVTSVWGTGWARDVAVLVPSTPPELTAVLGSTASVTAQVAAAATSDGQDTVSGAVYGQRLVVEADRARRLTAVGLRIVVQHEITHIADAPATSDASPRWLVEGFAEYVGNLGSGQPVGEAAGELRADVRRGHVPASLPSSADFDASSTAAQAYEGSWLACRLIARRVGQAGLVRFYRAVAASPQDAATATVETLRSVLHESAASFTAQWRADVVTELGR